MVKEILKKLRHRITGVNNDTTVEEISTIEELGDIRDNLDGHYKIVEPIDASPTETWNNGRGFKPIGTVENPFTGRIEGDENLISGLTINRPDEDYVGLIGVAGEDAEVNEIYLDYVNIVGSDYVGSVFGDNFGHSHISFTSGSVQGERFVGGVAGSNTGLAQEGISLCSVDGEYSVGGFVGENIGTVECCFADFDNNDFENADSKHSGYLIGTNSGRVLDDEIKRRIESTTDGELVEIGKNEGVVKERD